MKLLNTNTSINPQDADTCTESVFTRTSIAAVSKGTRVDRQGRTNYGVLIDGRDTEFEGWVNVYIKPGEVKLHQGAWVYVDGWGQIATEDAVKADLKVLANW